MKNKLRIILCSSIFLMGLLLLLGLLDPLIINFVLSRIGRPPGSKSMYLIKLIGISLILFSVFLYLFLKNKKSIERFIDNTIKRKLNEIESRFENKFGNIINFSSKWKKIKWNEINKWDSLILFFSLILSIFMVLERLQNNYPDVILGSDAANISSMALAINNPDSFKQDFYLQDQENFKIYFQLHIVLIRLLSKLLQNYSLPFVFLLGPTTFFILFGNYWMGRTILNNRLWALLLVIFNCVPVYLLFENWGLAEDAVPRTFMQALLPFLITSIWLWRDQYEKWKFIAIFTGLLTYIHAVGTPTIMALVIFSFFVMTPQHWTIKKKILTIISLSIIMVLVGSVFIFNYLSVKQQVQSFDYQIIIRLYREFFPPNILDVTNSVKLLIKFYWKTWILSFGLIGFIALWLLRNESRRLSKLLFSWILAISIVSIVIPFTERIVESYLRILPIETELIRGTRFFVPTLGLLTIAGLCQLSKFIKFRIMSYVLVIIGVLFIWHYFRFSSTNLLLFEKTTKCIQTGYIFCNEKSDLQKLFSEINKSTPEKASIFFTNDSHDTLPLGVRYISYRSLVYSWKDRGMGFSNPPKMIQWHNIFSLIDQYETTTDWFLKNPSSFIEFTKKLNADYFVLNKQNQNLLIETNFGEIIYENPTYILVKIH